jgi:hypothetical protein
MAGTDLFIKFSTASPNDTGARPISPCGPPNIIWDSQAIWLSKPDDPLSTLTKATTGQEIQVNVTVNNKGGAAFVPDAANGIFVTVQVWICNFAIAVGPNGGITSAGGANGQDGLITATIPAGGSRPTAVKWKPVVGDLNINTTAAGEGHVCVAANVFWEGNAPEKESRRFPPPGSLAVCGDPDPGERNGGHHGQKNILIAKGESGESMAIPMNVFNLQEEGDEFVIEALEARGAKVALRMAEREVLLAEDFITLAGGKARVRPKMVEGEPIEPIERARLRAGGKLVLGSGKRPLRLSRRRIEDFQLEARGEEGKKIKLEVPRRRPKRLELKWDLPKEAPGAVHVFDVTQRGRRGRNLGGARIIVVTQ